MKNRMLTIGFICSLLMATPVFQTPAFGDECSSCAMAGDAMLALYSKDSSTWKIIKNGPKGQLEYNKKTGIYIFIATGLSPLTHYSLVRYAGIPLEGDFIAGEKTDLSGRLKLQGTWNNWSQKIWLVLSSDISVTGNRGRIIAWHPDRYLFEDKVL